MKIAPFPSYHFKCNLGKLNFQQNDKTVIFEEHCLSSLINVQSVLILIASQILNKQFVRLVFICYQSFTDLDHHLHHGQSPNNH